MGPGAIPNNQQLAVQVTQEMSEKLDHLRTADRAREQPEIEVPPRHPGHGRQGLPVEVILQHRCLPSRCPSPATMRPLAQSTFVDKNDYSPLVLGFFLSLANVCASTPQWPARPVL